MFLLLGIESCFFEDMAAVSIPILHHGPLLVLSLLLAATPLTSLTGSRAVPLLATLFLLSYNMKLIINTSVTIIAQYQPASLFSVPISAIAIFIIILRPVKDWDQPNFTVLITILYLIFSKVKDGTVLCKVSSDSPSFVVADDTYFSPAHQTTSGTPPISWRYFSQQRQHRRGTSRSWTK